MLTGKPPLAPFASLRNSLKNLAHNFFFFPLIILLVTLAIAFAFQRSGKLDLPLFSDKAAPAFVQGFYPLENNGSQTFRWTAGQANIDLPETLLPAKVNLEVIGVYPDPNRHPTLKLLYQDKELGSWTLGNDWTALSAPFPAGLELNPGDLTLRVDNALAPRKDDPRELGVAIRSASLDIRRTPPLGNILAVVLFGQLVYLAALKLKFRRQEAFFVAVAPPFLLALYWANNLFLARVFTGWLMLGSALLLLLAFKPAPLSLLSPFSRLLSLRILKIAPLVAFMLLALLIFNETLAYGFVYDDYHFARPWGFGEVLGTYAGTWDPWGLELVYLRPITVTSYALNWFWSEYNPLGFHAVNILLHGLNTGLIYLFLRRTRLQWLGATLAALFYLLVPSNADTATWVSQRGDALVVLFILGAFLALQSYWASFSKKWLVVLNICLVLALLSKEIAVVIPVCLLLYSWLFLPVLQNPQKLETRPEVSRREWLLVGTVPFLVVIVYFGYRSLVVPGLVNLHDLAGILNNYLQILVYTFTEINDILSKLTPFWPVLLLLLLGVGFAARVNRYTWYLVGFGAAWVALTCLPLALIGVYDGNARLLYLPEVGYAFIIGGLFALPVSAFGESPGKLKLRWLIGPVLVVLIFMLALPYQPLETARQRSQVDYAPYSVKTLTRDEYIYNSPQWKAKLPATYYNFIENKLRQIGRIPK